MQYELLGGFLRCSDHDFNPAVGEELLCPCAHSAAYYQLDLQTGDFRCVGSGALHRGQKVLGVVRNAPLSGNILQVLGRLVDLASDTDRVGHVDAPGMLVDGVQVG